MNLMNKSYFYIVSLLLFILSNSVFSQSTDKNYLKTTKLLEPVSITTLNSSSSTIQKKETISYMDGLGRTTQTIGIKQSPMGKDVILHNEYDQYGRSIKQFLPLPTTQTSGNYFNNASTNLSAYYQTNFSDNRPYSESRFDESPMNRLNEQSSAGDTWLLNHNSDTDHTKKLEYGSNDLNEVYNIKLNESNTTQPFIFNYYLKGTLEKSIVKNENWKASDGKLNTTELFTDKNKRLVAKFSYVEDGSVVKKLATYNVYDKVGNLIYIFPPKAMENLWLIDSFTSVNSNYVWSDFVQTPALVTNGTGNVHVSVLGYTNATTSLSYKRLKLDFDLSFPYIAGFPTPGGGAHLKLGNVVTLPAGTNLADQYLFSVYPGGKRGSTVLELEFPGSTGGVTEKSRYEYRIIGGNVVVEFKIGTDFGSPTVPFLVYKIERLFQRDFSTTVFNQTIINDLCFQYKYDDLNRQIEQKIPGKGWEYVVYDLLDRPILTQDALLKAQQKWLFTKYDVHGRVLYSGVYNSTLSRELLQEQVFNYINLNTGNQSNFEQKVGAIITVGGLNMRYTNNAFPNTSISEIFAVNFYDNYNISDPYLPIVPSAIQGQSVSTNVKGLQTSSWVRTIGGYTWNKSYSFYDNKARVIGVKTRNYLGGHTNNETKLDFNGKIVTSVTNHKRIASSIDLMIKDDFEYDHAERVKTHKQKINSQPEELISENIYDELGQLLSKGLGGAITSVTRLQTINYKYNIRGWLTEINDVTNLGADLFAYKLNYQTGDGAYSVTPQFNGNISQVVWGAATDNIKKSYLYTYDKLNRLKSAKYTDGPSLSSNFNRFSSTVSGYDSNGNISGVIRYGVNSSGVFTTIDNLSYNYDTGNKLMSVADITSNTLGFNDGNTSGNDYDYDINGNITKDNNKNISLIQYNRLDLVSTVVFNNGDTIDFTYDSSGVKLKMEVTHNGVTTVTDYLGGFQYRNNQLLFFPTTEGYVQKNATSFSYTYIIKDHLGNNRLSFSDGDNNGIVALGETLSQTNYYPMGLTHSGAIVVGGASNYNYYFQSKEQLLDNGYNMYDFGSRMYDSSVGRWFNTDPQNQFASPYEAMGNNYIVTVDPNGEWIHIVIGAAVGGAINLAMNWDNIDSFGEGAAAFGVGALVGGATAACGQCGAAAAIAIGGGALMGATNNVIAQVDDEHGLGDVDWSSTIESGFVGGLSGYASYGAGQYATQTLGPVLINSFNVTSPVLNGAINGAVGGAAGGYAGGFTGGYLMTGTLDGAMDGGMEGLKTGAAIGGASGAASSYVNALSHNTNPWTGKAMSINDVKVTKAGIAKIKSHLSRPELDYDLANDVMIRRLENIASGKATATSQDLYYYTHEIRELYLMKFNGMKYNDAHEKSLSDYGLDYKKSYLIKVYTQDAMNAGDGYHDWLGNGKRFLD